VANKDAGEQDTGGAEGYAAYFDFTQFEAYGNDDGKNENGMCRRREVGKK
jgi:hypothetical protein